jgi:hypothetical protein
MELFFGLWQIFHFLPLVNLFSVNVVVYPHGVEVEVNLRLTVSQSVLVSGAHLGPVTNFSFSSKFSSDSCVFVIL